MAETAPQTLERCVADLTALQQELEKMTARVPRHQGTKEGLQRGVVEPVLVIKGK